METPPGHTSQRAHHESRRRATATLAFSDGHIEMSPGMARVTSAGRHGAEVESGPATATLESIRAEVIHHGTLLKGDLAAQGLHNTLNAVHMVAANPVPSDAGKEYRSLLSRLLVGLRRFAAALARFPRRVEAVRRAIQLKHMAEQSWEDFVANHAEPGPSWSKGEWEKRRGRRLAALEQRSAELVKAQAAATPEQERACAQDLAARAEHLEGLSRAFVVREPPRMEPATVSQVPRRGPARDVATPTLRPSSPRPRFH